MFAPAEGRHPMPRLDTGTTRYHPSTATADPEAVSLKQVSAHCDPGNQFVAVTQRTNIELFVTQHTLQAQEGSWPKRPQRTVGIRASTVTPRWAITPRITSRRTPTSSRCSG